MLDTGPLLEQFRHFYTRNYPNDMEQQIEFFSFFGGLNLPIDIDVSIEQAVINLLSQEFSTLNTLISTLSQEYQPLLSAIAKGDRRLHSAFKRAHMSEAKGGAAVNFLQKQNVLNLEYSRETPPQKEYPKQRLKKEIREHRISHKVQFRAPFLRFWFYFVAPLQEEIERGEYTSLRAAIEEHQHSFCAYSFEKLSNLFLEMQLRSDPVIESGSYWDRKVEIDLYAQRSSGAIIVGECKWRNHKMNKKELHKLRDKCDKLSLTPQHIALFSKRGFSNELIHNTKENLLLFSAEDFKSLLT